MTVLGWIADKFGYQRKLRKTTLPQTFIPDSVMKEREDDNCLPPNYIFPHLLTQELIDDGIAKVGFNPQFTVNIYEDDHGSPGNEMADDLFIVKD